MGRYFQKPGCVVAPEPYLPAPRSEAQELTANMRVTDLLRTMDIFEAIPSEELETIAQLLRERRLAEAEVLCRQGDPGDALFIVTGGRTRPSTTRPSGQPKNLAYFTGRPVSG